MTQRLSDWPPPTGPYPVPLYNLQTRTGMFGGAGGRPDGIVPDIADIRPNPDLLSSNVLGFNATADMLSRASGQVSPDAGASDFRTARKSSPGSVQCPLVPLNAASGTIGAARGADLRFSPAFADIIRSAADALSRERIVPHINNGFRTAADQLKMREGGSGANPAATFSDHQLGNALDLDGTKLASFRAVIAAFKRAGARWGGDYHGRKDPPHFYIRPVRANPRNTAECESENPR